MLGRLQSLLLLFLQFAVSSEKPLLAQSIPQPVLDERGRPRKISELRSKEGVLEVELLLRGLNQPQSAIWVPLRSINKDFVDRYNQFSGNDGQALLVSELKGGIWVLFQQTLYPLQGLPNDVEQRGEGGYLDLHYNSWSGHLFISYARSLSATLSTLSVLSARLHYSEQQFFVTDIREIFQAQPPLNAPRGYGGHLSSTREFLYIALGSAGHPEQAQSIRSHWGSTNKISLHRPLPDRREREIFPGSIRSGPNSARSQMLSIGHGNVQDLFWDPYQQRMWLVEQLRERSGRIVADKINLLGEGRNYGWGLKTTELPAQRREQGPVLRWERSYGWSSALVLPGRTSGVRNQFRAWAGNLLIASLQSRRLYRLRIDPTQGNSPRPELLEQLFADGSLGPLRWVRLGPDGALYLLANSTQASSGRMWRIQPQSKMFFKASH